MLDMLADICFAGLVQIDKLRLRQPDRFVLHAYINACKAVFGLIDDDLAFIVTHIFHLCSRSMLRMGLFYLPCGR